MIALIDHIRTLDMMKAFDFGSLCAPAERHDEGDGHARELVAAAHVHVGDAGMAAPIVCMTSMTSLPAIVSELPIMAFARQVARESLPELLSALCIAADLKAFIPVQSEPQGITLKALVASYVSQPKLVSSVSALTKALHGEEPECKLDSQDAFAMFSEVASCTKFDTVGLPEAMCCQPSGVSIDVAIALAELYMLLHHTMAGLGWLSNLACSPGGPVPKHELNKDLDRVLEMVSVYSGKAKDLLAAKEELFLSLEALDLHLALKPPVICQWLTHLKPTMRSVQQMFHQDMLKSLGALTKLVKSHIPPL